jgi:hypothetical protein
MIDRVVLSFRGEVSWMTVYFTDGTHVVREVNYEFLSYLTNKENRDILPQVTNVANGVVYPMSSTA